MMELAVTLVLSREGSMSGYKNAPACGDRTRSNRK